MGMAREKGKQTNPTARLGYTPPVICKTLSITDLRKLRQTLHWVQVLGRERFACPTLPWGLLQVRDGYGCRNMPSQEKTCHELRKL